MRLPAPTWVDSTASTQVTLSDQARAGVVSRVLATTSQTAGRGRRGREWTCPPGAGLAMSVLVRLPPRDGWSWLPLAAGVAVHQALTDLGVPPSLGLKWPNDVLVDDGPGAGKLAGIIAERVDAPGGSDPALVLGMPGVKEAIRVTRPYKLVSREFKPEDTVVTVGEVPIGNGHPVIIAGPCAIESLDQALTIA